MMKMIAEAAHHRIIGICIKQNRYAVFVMAMVIAILVAVMDICKAQLPVKRTETAIAVTEVEIAEVVAGMVGCNKKPVCHKLNRITNSNPHGFGCADFSVHG